MPNIKSAIKRVKVNEAKAIKNTIKKSALKTTIKKCNEAIENNDATKAKIVKDTVKAIDKAAAKGILHKNTAARRKSRIAKAAK